MQQPAARTHLRHSEDHHPTEQPLASGGAHLRPRCRQRGRHARLQHGLDHGHTRFQKHAHVSANPNAQTPSETLSGTTFKAPSNNQTNINPRSASKLTSVKQNMQSHRTHCQGKILVVVHERSIRCVISNEHERWLAFVNNQIINHLARLLLE